MTLGTNPTASSGSAPLYVITCDPRFEIIRVTVKGFWLPQTAAIYFSELMPILADQRRRYGRAKVLIDRRGGVPQSAETLAATISWFNRAYLVGDVSALVVDSSLVKMQLKRAYPADRATLFVSYRAAEIWLEGR